MADTDVQSASSSASELLAFQEASKDGRKFEAAKARIESQFESLCEGIRVPDLTVCSSSARGLQKFLELASFHGMHGARIGSNLVSLRSRPDNGQPWLDHLVNRALHRGLYDDLARCHIRPDGTLTLLRCLQGAYTGCG